MAISCALALDAVRQKNERTRFVIEGLVGLRLVIQKKRCLCGTIPRTQRRGPLRRAANPWSLEDT